MDMKMGGLYFENTYGLDFKNGSIRNTDSTKPNTNKSHNDLVPLEYDLNRWQNPPKVCHPLTREIDHIPFEAVKHNTDRPITNSH
ncbi:hypothetical protein KDK_70060 [Dictyobacter kobayashii]|uniref:Uncharacterized protein n=1 Tax=Dictyobacter kobayashii TaxID=2014872 RepID=A0A402AVR1_9CHLR|nr:hypothetical protein KDK_70060 [Dictyobacter kobayashii]